MLFCGGGDDGVRVCFDTKRAQKEALDQRRREAEQKRAQEQERIQAQFLKARMFHNRCFVCFVLFCQVVKCLWGKKRTKFVDLICINLFVLWFFPLVFFSLTDNEQEAENRRLLDQRRRAADNREKQQRAIDDAKRREVCEIVFFVNMYVACLLFSNFKCFCLFVFLNWYIELIHYLITA